jgi:geranylgeranyl diphosphate synthase type I
VASLSEKRLTGEELSEYIAKLFEERGKKALEIARRIINDEITRLSCEEAREALKYFMNTKLKDTTRPSLLSIACEALGGEPEKTTPIAVPLILISSAVDVHDDIIDHSIAKKGKLTLYGKFGKDMALLIGDALLFKGFTLLCEAGKKFPLEKISTIFELIKNLFFELGEAEAYELSLRRREVIEIEEYMELVRRKAADFEAYMRISALIAEASNEETEALGKYGRLLGMLIILGDDNADMLDPSEIINRVRNEVLPLPIIYALHKPHLRRKIVTFLRKKKMTRKDAEKISDIIYEASVFNEIEKKHVLKFIRAAKNALKDIKNRELLIQVLESTYPKDF